MQRFDKYGKELEIRSTIHRKVLLMEKKAFIGVRRTIINERVDGITRSKLNEINDKIAEIIVHVLNTCIIFSNTHPCV